MPGDMILGAFSSCCKRGRRWKAELLEFITRKDKNLQLVFTDFDIIIISEKRRKSRKIR